MAKREGTRIGKNPQSVAVSVYNGRRGRISKPTTQIDCLQRAIDEALLSGPVKTLSREEIAALENQYKQGAKC